MKIINYFLILVSIILLISCEDIKNWNVQEFDDIPPGVVTNVKAIGTHGGAIITYDLPSDNDLIGVKGIFYFNEDDEKPYEVYSSAYTDTLRIEGLPNTDPREVQLICVDYSRNESEPVSVIVEPLIPQIEVIKNNLVLQETFGGLYLSWDNPFKEEIGITLYYEDEKGDFILDYTFFSNMEHGEYSYRGYESKPTKFRIALVDRFRNYTEPFDTILTPKFEENVVRRTATGNATWKRYGMTEGYVNWMGDYRQDHTTAQTTFQALFDGKLTTYYHPGLADTYKPSFYTLRPEDDDDVTGFRLGDRTMYFTIDMMEWIYLSRFYISGRNIQPVNANDLIHFRIWASIDEPKKAVDFNNDRIESLQYWTNWPKIEAKDTWKNDWYLLGEYHLIPPSGAIEMYEWTNADGKWLSNGVELDFAPEHANKAFRYLRFECIRNVKGEGNKTHQITRLDFWGQYPDTIVE